MYIIRPHWCDQCVPDSIGTTIDWTWGDGYWWCVAVTKSTGIGDGTVADVAYNDNHSSATSEHIEEYYTDD